MEPFAGWMKLERRWMAAYRKKMLKTTVFVPLPLTALVLGGLMAATSLMYGGFFSEELRDRTFRMIKAQKGHVEYVS